MRKHTLMQNNSTNQPKEKSKRQQYQAAQREQQRQQVEDIARVAFANKVSKLISINSMYVLSPTELQFDFEYSGNKPVRVEMLAVLTEIDKNSKVSAWILDSGTWITPSYSVVLEFDTLYLPIGVMVKKYPKIIGRIIYKLNYRRLNWQIVNYLTYRHPFY